MPKQDAMLDDLLDELFDNEPKKEPEKKQVKQEKDDYVPLDESEMPDLDLDEDMIDLSEPEPSPKVSKKNQSNSLPSSDDVEVDLPEQKYESTSIKLGQKVSSSAVPRFKGTTSKKSRIAVFVLDVRAVKFHYDKKMGGVICFNGDCCKTGFSKTRYVVPIFEYESDSKGNYVPNGGYELKALSLGSEAYDSLVSVVEGVDDIRKYDIIVTCSDEQYQKMTFAAYTKDTATYLKDKEEYKKKFEFYKSVKDRIDSVVAKRMTPDTFRALLSQKVNEEPPSIDDVLR